MSVEDNVKDTPEVLLEKLRAANAEAKQYREAKEALEAKVGEYESDTTLQKYQERIVKTEAKSRLLQSGVKDPDRVLKYLKSEGVKVTDDGLEGLDDVIKTVQTDFPELFDAKRRVAGAADAGAHEAPQVAKTASELQAERILGIR